MNESRINLTKRLQREGRWDEASLFKDEKISELRADGLTRPVAQGQAWEQMAERFPLLEILEEDEPSVPIFTLEEIASLPPGSLAEFAADVDWVYGNLEGGEESLAPSAGAVGLLRWARANTNEFFGKILPKALQLQEKGPDSEQQAKEENLKHARGLRERLGKFNQDFREEHDAIAELKQAKGFAKDSLGFAAYLRGLVGE